MYFRSSKSYREGFSPGLCLLACAGKLVNLSLSSHYKQSYEPTVNVGHGVFTLSQSRTSATWTIIFPTNGALDCYDPKSPLVYRDETAS
jgi:hypothetical protein